MLFEPNIGSSQSSFRILLWNVGGLLDPYHHEADLSVTYFSSKKDHYFCAPGARWMLFFFQREIRQIPRASSWNPLGSNNVPNIGIFVFLTHKYSKALGSDDWSERQSTAYAVARRSSLMLSFLALPRKDRAEQPTAVRCKPDFVSRHFLCAETPSCSVLVRKNIKIE